MLLVASVVVSIAVGQRHTGLEHRAEDAAEAFEDRVLDDALDDRDLEHHPVLEVLAGLAHRTRTTSGDEHEEELAVMNHRSVKKRAKNSIIRVGSGSSASSSSNSGLNCGST